MNIVINDVYQYEIIVANIKDDFKSKVNVIHNKDRLLDECEDFLDNLVKIQTIESFDVKQKALFEENKLIVKIKFSERHKYKIKLDFIPYNMPKEDHYK